MTSNGPCEAVEQIGAAEVDAPGNAEAPRVLPRDVERHVAKCRSRQSAPPAARWQSPPPRSRCRCRDRRPSDDPVDLRKQLERDLDDQLGLGSRDQHRRRDFERQPPELLLADDVGERFPAEAALDERLIPGGEIRRFAVVRGRDEPLGAPAERELREQPGVELGAFRRKAGIRGTARALRPRAGEWN